MTTTTATTSRLLALLSLLQTRRDWPGPILAERLDITHRTVRRDVERLREMGYSIRALRGPAGGYRLDAGTELPPLLFDDDQAVALALALQSAASSGADIDEAAVRALATVRQVMPPRLRHRLDSLDVTVLPGRPSARPSGDPSSTAEQVSPGLLVDLSTAVRAREVLRLDYASTGEQDRDRDDTRRESRDLRPPRRIEPHHVVTSHGRWYLVAWDLDADGWRIFRTDRITLRTPNGPRFTPREVPGGEVRSFVSAQFKGARRADVWPCLGTAVLDLPAAAVLPFVGDGSVEALGHDRCRITVGSWSWVALAASLGRFGAVVTGVEPPELVDAFSLLAVRYAEAATASR
ncbi:helix-turn-helix transcriptional regulator [Sanguibacter antarcticus]|uniref:HTH domain-containing protein n=1 Tax=Sanguibacter antarcticus TaxID=372484 RepID=A0A2A9E7C5_9MICO|nr:WYL domain-containing protein [Sanguibacter antarcticus]PFG34536.1 HTH domain-containing protein [Sanguibacter antarcticus]